jgi:hypothetical protein
MSLIYYIVLSIRLLSYLSKRMVLKVDHNEYKLIFIVIDMDRDVDGKKLGRPKSITLLAVLFIIGAIFCLNGLYYIIMGIPYPKNINEFAGPAPYMLAATCIFCIFTAIGLLKTKKWAWKVILAIPLFFTIAGLVQIAGLLITNNPKPDLLFTALIPVAIGILVIFILTRRKVKDSFGVQK